MQTLIQSVKTILGQVKEKLEAKSSPHLATAAGHLAQAVRCLEGHQAASSAAPAAAAPAPVAAAAPIGPAAPATVAPAKAAPAKAATAAQ